MGRGEISSLLWTGDCRLQRVGGWTVEARASELQTQIDPLLLTGGQRRPCNWPAAEKAHCGPLALARDANGQLGARSVLSVLSVRSVHRVRSECPVDAGAKSFASRPMKTVGRAPHAPPQPHTLDVTRWGD